MGILTVAPAAASWHASRVLLYCPAMRRYLAPLLLFSLALLPRAAGSDPPKSPEKSPDTITIYVTGEIHNTTEPCGCTTEVLGDVSRVAALVKDRAAPERTLLLDTGALRFGEARPGPEALAQARLKADFLEDTWRRLGARAAIQPEDLLYGTSWLAGSGARRLACNLTGLPVEPAEIVRVGPVRVGVIGVAAPEAPWPAGIRAAEPRPAVEKAAAALRRQGADLLVALTGLPRQKARQLAAAVPDLDVVVAGDGLRDPVMSPEVVGKALLVMPVSEGKYAVRLTFSLGPKGQVSARLYRDQAAQAREIERLSRYAARLREQLAEMRKDAQADPAYVKRIQNELAAAEAATVKARAEAKNGPPSPSGGHVTMALVPLRRSLPRDPEVARAMTALDRRIGEENLRQVKEARPAPIKGQPTYVGNAGCLGSCHVHEDTIAQWKGTRHSHAWQTLVEVSKQLSYDCVGCHATGFHAPGGANLRTLALSDQQAQAQAQGPSKKAAAPVVDLRDVGCEICHGPGSEHVKRPVKTPPPVPRPGEERCLDCHTKDHSDTFEFTAYLRDVLGEDHGEERRRALGKGPTGAELRKAGLAKHAGP